jgi:hypothetical protein
LVLLDLLFLAVMDDWFDDEACGVCLTLAKAALVPRVSAKTSAMANPSLFFISSFSPLAYPADGFRLLIICRAGGDVIKSPHTRSSVAPLSRNVRAKRHAGER